MTKHALQANKRIYHSPLPVFIACVTIAVAFVTLAYSFWKAFHEALGF